MPSQCYYQHYLKKGGVSTLDKRRQVGLNMQYHPMVKEEKPKAEGVSKPKRGCFQQSTSIRKASFKAPTTVLEDKVLIFGKKKHSVDFVKNCEAIAKHIVVN